jgi:outer membrane receptor protein involved in Fe transport
VPVSESFAFRVAADYGKSSGYIDHYSLGGTLTSRGVNSETDAVVQVTGKWLLPNDLTLTPSLFYQRIAGADSPTFIPAQGMFNQNKQVAEFNHDQLIIPSLTIRKGFEGLDMTSITSYVDRRIDRQADGTFFNSAALAQFFLDPAYPQFQVQNDTILANIASPVLFTDRFQTATQEFRLSSPASAKDLKWVAGAFYADQKWSHLDYEVAPGFGAAFQGIYGHSIVNDPIMDPIGDPALWANDLVWTVNDHNRIKQYSVFGQIDFDVSPTLHLGIGERFVSARETFTETGGGIFDLGGAGVPPSPPYSQAAHFKSWTPKFSATYDVSPDATLYATAAKGFRLGGATTPNTNVACVQGLQQLGFNNAPSTYGSDELWSYEFGTKALLADKTVSVNADIYLIDWQRIQQTIIIPICGGQFNANVGDARAYGSEIELRYKPREVAGLTLGMGIGAERAYITRTINSSTAAVGQSILFTPKFTATLTADYGWKLTDDRNGFVRGTYGYIGTAYGSYDTTSSQYINPAYSTATMEAGVKFRDVEIALFAKNLFDNQTILQRPQINSVIEGYTQRPRTIGITINQKL